MIEPERLVFTLSDQPGGSGTSSSSVVLTDLGDGRTEMHFEQRGHMEAQQYKRAEQGWSSFFARVEQRLGEVP